MITKIKSLSVEELGKFFHSPTPRDVPATVRREALKGLFLVELFLAGVVLIIFSVPFLHPFFQWRLIDELRLDLGRLAEAQGEVTQSEDTGLWEGGWLLRDSPEVPASERTPIYRIAFRFETGGADPSHEMLVDLHRRRIVVVAVDAWTGSIRTDAVHSDFARGAFELTEQFAWRGHRRIALVLPRGYPLVGREAERGYQTAMSRNGLSPMAVVSYVPGDGAVPLSGVERPSAVIGYPGASAERFLLMVDGSDVRAVDSPPLSRHSADRLAKGMGHSGSTLSSANAKFAGPSVGLLCSPGESPPSGHTASIPYYRVSAEDFVEWVVRLLLEAEPGHPARQAIVPGRLMGGMNPRPEAAGPFTSPGPAHV